MPGEASPASQPVAQPAKNTVPANAARAASRCAIITPASPSRPSSSHTEAQSADRKLHRYLLVNRRPSGTEPLLHRGARQAAVDEPTAAAGKSHFMGAPSTTTGGFRIFLRTER